MGAGIGPEPETPPRGRRALRRSTWIVFAVLGLSACGLSCAANHGAGGTSRAGPGSPAAAPTRPSTAPAGGASSDSSRAGGTAAGGDLAVVKGAGPAGKGAASVFAQDMALGREARKDGRLADASIAFERVIRADPTAFDARLELVEVLLLQSIDLVRAGALLDEARALRAYDVKVDRLRAWLDELRGDPAAAAADYARVLAANPDPEIRLRRASMLLRVNRIDDAIEEYERVLAEQPTDRVTRMTLSDIYEHRGRLEDAEKMLLENERLAPGEITPLRRLGTFYRRTGQIAKATEVEARVRAREAPPRTLRPLRPSVR